MQYKSFDKMADDGKDNDEANGKATF